MLFLNEVMAMASVMNMTFMFMRRFVVGREAKHAYHDGAGLGPLGAGL